jgi:hypothetical protein
MKEPNSIQTHVSRDIGRRVQEEVFKQFGLTEVDTLGISTDGFSMDVSPGGGLVVVPLVFKATGAQIDAIRQAAFLTDIERLAGVRPE